MDRTLSLDLFTRPGDDFEKRQYLVMGSLKDIRKQFQQNRLYPYLSVLLDLRENLNHILDGFTGIDVKGPKRIKRIDLLNKRIEFESTLPSNMDLDAIKDLIEWAQPLISEAISEGISIYEFVDENLKVDTVGIQPGYKDEGYLFVPDHKTGGLRLFRYEMSIYLNSRESYRALKTTLFKTLDNGIMPHSSPGAIKLELIREFKDMPNPATYAFHTPLEFSFSSTLFPVAKRKLLRLLVS